MLKDYAPLENYLIRTFSVEIWEKCFGTSGMSGSKCNLKDYEQDEFLYNSLYAHIKKVEGIIGTDFSERDFTIANHMSYFKDVLPFINYLHDQIIMMENEFNFIIRRRKDWIDDPSAIDIAETLLQGKVYWDE